MILLLILVALLILDCIFVSYDKYIVASVFTIGIFAFVGLFFFQEVFHTGPIAQWLGELPGITTGFSWLNCAVFFAYYLGAGAIYSVVKWYFHVRRYVERIIDNRETTLMKARNNSKVATTFYNHAVSNTIKGGEDDALVILKECFPGLYDQYSTVRRIDRDNIKAFLDAADVQAAAEPNNPIHAYLFNTITFLSGESEEWISMSKLKDIEVVRDMIAPRATRQKARITFWIWNWPASLFVTIFDDFFRKIVDKMIRMLNHLYKRLTMLAMRGV